MAVFGPWTAASLTIDGIVLGTRMASATLAYEAAAVDVSCHGLGTTVNAGGLKSWSAEIEFKQDFSSSSVDDRMFASVGTTVALVLKATTAATSGTNPAYTGTGILTSYTPFDGSLGDALPASISIVSAGALSRSTS